MNQWYCTAIAAQTPSAAAIGSAQTFADPMTPTTLAGGTGYDALNHRGRRKGIERNTKSEDYLLRGFNRDRLIENGRDLERNFALFAWAVQQHLNYVCDLNFQPQTGDDELDSQLESLVETWSEAENWDAAGRHDREQWIRLAESATITGGDMLAVKLATGHVQAIESDRIRSPQDPNNANWEAGILRDHYGRARKYCVYARGRSGLGFESPRVVDATNAEMIGYFRRFDQGRGVSPMASAFNQYRDTYENLDHANQRAKLSNILAFVLKRASVDQPFDYNDIDLGPGLSILDMNPGDEGEFKESHLPSNEFQSFVRETITLGLKGLDIPMSFYREDLTNFFGSRAALMHYLRSCRWKRRRLQRLLQRLTAWRIGLWLANGLLRLPKGFDPNQLRFSWSPAGIPWWDPSKEVAGDMLAVGAGWGDPFAIALEKTGEPLERNLRQTVKAIALAQRLAKEAGVDFQLSFTPPSTSAPTTIDERPNENPGDKKATPET
jgi:capsid protein